MYGANYYSFEPYERSEYERYERRKQGREGRKNNVGPYSHRPQSSRYDQPCRYYNTAGGCNRGNHCWFQHMYVNYLLKVTVNFLKWTDQLSEL